MIEEIKILGISDYGRQIIEGISQLCDSNQCYPFIHIFSIVLESDFVVILEMMLLQFSIGPGKLEIHINLKLIIWRFLIIFNFMKIWIYIYYYNNYCI